MNKGTFTVAPVSTVDGLSVFVAVSPFMPGSVYVTSNITDDGKSHPKIFSSSA